jgi:replicative DNA helicase
MASKYIDTSSIVQVIGCVFVNPQLLDFTDKYFVSEEDFPDEFHKVVFGSIYKLHELGANKITLESINDFLSSRKKKEAIYLQNKGDEWLTRVAQSCNLLAFDYYYNRMKKFTLLRAYNNCGIDVTDIYDIDNILDVKKKQLQEEQLDNMSLSDIAVKVDEKVDKIKMQYVDDTFGHTAKAGDNLDDLLEELAQHPDVGIPLYGSLINTVTRGARLRKMYLRSAPSGFGKTRTMVADVCYIGCNKIYDETFGWINNGCCEPVLYITTEQELSEIQTLMLAFLSNVNEDHILNNKYEEGEKERVLYAKEVIKNSAVYIVELPDFSLQDVENIIKQNIRDNDVKYVAFDYIMSSLKILGEIAGRTGGIKLREDNILFMMSRRLKDIANEYGVFVLSGTQLNGDWKEAEMPDQNLLRGAKSIADSIDFGCHILPVTSKDLEALKPVIDASTFDIPNTKIAIYKNRRGRYKSVYLWCKSNLGTCRVNPMYCTDFNYELVQMNDLKIKVSEKAAF